jgi:hypothetical protein
VRRETFRESEPFFSFVVVYAREYRSVERKAYLQVKADKYRRYVGWIGDPETARRILGLASELEQQAAEPNQENIRARAYDLWKLAGEPEDRDEEFWLQAEQELLSAAKSPAPREVG